MITTSSFYHIDFVEAHGAQKLKAAFASNAHETLYLSYSGQSQSFRVQYGEAQRLFLFKTDFFAKTLFRNEYGVFLGKVVPDQIHTGCVSLDENKYRFLISGKDINLCLLDSKTNDVLLKTELQDDLLPSNLDERNKQDFIHCIIFSFGWSLKQQLL